MGKASPYFHFPVVPTIQKNAWYLYIIYIYSVLERQERRNCVKTHGCWGSQTSSRQPAKLARASWMTRARVTGVRRAKLYNNYLRRGGRKPAPKAMLMVFFVSALKYLEVKAVASC